MTIDEANALVRKLPDMVTKDRAKAIDSMKRAGFGVIHNPSMTMVRLGVPSDVMLHLLLAELNDGEAPEVRP